MNKQLPRSIGSCTEAIFYIWNYRPSLTAIQFPVNDCRRWPLTNPQGAWHHVFWGLEIHRPCGVLISYFMRLIDWLTDCVLSQSLRRGWNWEITHPVGKDLLLYTYRRMSRVMPECISWWVGVVRQWTYHGTRNNNRGMWINRLWKDCVGWDDTSHAIFEILIRSANLSLH